MCHSRLFAHAVYHVHLVFHQRYERRHDNCRTFHQERGQLVAKRLAASRRHEHESVVAGEQVADYLLLFSLEAVETEIVLQFFSKINIISHITSCFLIMSHSNAGDSMQTSVVRTSRWHRVFYE